MHMELWKTEYFLWRKGCCPFIDGWWGKAGCRLQLWLVGWGWAVLVFRSLWLFDQEKPRMALELKGQLGTDISISEVERNLSVCRLAILCLWGCGQFLAVMWKRALRSEDSVVHLMKIGLSPSLSSAKQLLEAEYICALWLHYTTKRI